MINKPNLFRIAIFLYLTVIFIPFGLAADGTRHFVVVSGETHAMLKPCDCENEPGGGFAERAAILDSMRKTANIVLLDAGDFSGGGVYDVYTEGRENDSIRTIAAIKAMALMKYDAVAIGDDDLQYGINWLAGQAYNNKLPLVCANCRSVTGNSKNLIPEYLLVEKNGIKYGITAVVTTENSDNFNSDCTIDPPFETLNKIIPTLDSIADCIIILSHLGEAESRILLEKFPLCDIIVNGHRKTSTLAGSINNGKAFVQFGFQGKKLAAVEISSTTRKPVSAEWSGVSLDVKPDKTISDLIEAVVSLKKAPKSILDLYIMSGCTYGLSAVSEMLPVMSFFRETEFNIRFIGDTSSNGQLVSMFGDTAVFEEKLWLGVQTLYPDFYMDYVDLKSRFRLPGWNIVKQMELDSISLMNWINTNGERALKTAYNRSSRLYVKASPTLYYNNTEVPIPAFGKRIADLLCKNGQDRSPMCDSLPECFDNNDCLKSGFHGICQGEDGRGICEYTQAAKFDFVIIKPDSSVFDYKRDPSINTTRELFPGAEIKLINLSSSQAQILLDKFKPSALPFYLFGKNVQNDFNFEKIKDGIIDTAGWFKFKEGIIKKQYFYKRNADKKIVFYIDPAFPDLQSILESLKKEKTSGFEVKILPIIYVNPQETDVDSIESARRDSAIVWLKTYKPGMRHIKKLLINHYKHLTELDVRGPCEILVFNRELISVRNNEELVRTIMSLKPKDTISNQ